MYTQGSIVLIPFPFTDLSGSKVRPATIISNGKIGSDVIVVFLTTQKKLSSKHTVIINKTSENGLKVMSKILCSKIATLDAKIVLGEIGHLSKNDLVKVKKGVSNVLNIHS